MEKVDEERLVSFLNFLFGIDAGAMVFLLVVRGDKIGEGVIPFRLAFYAFEPQVAILAMLSLCIMLLRGSNLFLCDKQWFKKFAKCLAAIFLLLSGTVLVWCGLILWHNPDLLPSGKSQ